MNEIDVRPLYRNVMEYVARGGGIEGRINEDDLKFKYLKKINNKKIHGFKHSKIPSERNKFFMDTLGIMGGGERKMLRQVLQHLRAGSGLKDIINYLHLYDRDYSFNDNLSVSVEEICFDLFGGALLETEITKKTIKDFYKKKFDDDDLPKNVEYDDFDRVATWDLFNSYNKTKKKEKKYKIKENILNIAGLENYETIKEKFPFNQIKPMNNDVLMSECSVEVDTSPGPTYKYLGMKNKGESYDLGIESVKFMLNNFKKKENVPPVLWSLGGRPKLRSIQEAYMKVKEGKPNGRAIWVPDIEESIISQKFTKKIYELLSGSPLISPIMIGFDKFKQNMELKTWVDNYDCLIEMDYPKFDTNVSRKIINFAFDVLKRLFVMDYSDEAIFEWLRDQFIYSKIVMPDGKIVEKNGGIPSGSGFTSIIGSIVNYTIVKNTLISMKLPRDSYSILVFGDDTLIGMNQIHNTSFFNIGRKMRRVINSHHDIEIGIKDVKISTQKYVQVCIPVFRGDTSRGTSSMKSEDIIIQDVEPAPGKNLGGSHRWNYLFKHTWKFLSYSMKPDGSMIRPTFDVFLRIGNPEGKVKKLDDHITLLKMALLENFDNEHTRNRCYHYLYDCYWLRKHGIQDEIIKHRRIRARDREIDTLGEGCRMWYRRTGEQCYLEGSSVMLEFNIIFSKIVTELMTIRQSGVMTDEVFWRVRKKRFIDPKRIFHRFNVNKERVLRYFHSLGLIKGFVHIKRLIGEEKKEFLNKICNPLEVLEIRGSPKKMTEFIKMVRLLNEYKIKLLSLSIVPKFDWFIMNQEFYRVSPCDDGFIDDFDSLGKLLDRRRNVDVEI